MPTTDPRKIRLSHTYTIGLSRTDALAFVAHPLGQRAIPNTADRLFFVDDADGILTSAQVDRLVGQRVDRTHRDSIQNVCNALIRKGLASARVVPMVEAL